MAVLSPPGLGLALLEVSVPASGINPKSCGVRVLLAQSICAVLEELFVFVIEKAPAV
jgi:hypothetical protein